MDISSLDSTNTDHEEGAEACFKKLEERKNKSTPSIVIKTLILMILESDVFQFGNEYYRQITGTAMGTPIAPNYFQQNLLRDYSQKLDYHFWYGFILLTIFYSYGPVITARWIISFPSHKITVNSRT